MTDERCWLGHVSRSYECPACGELATGNVATEEHWRWFRNRTSSKRIKGLIDMRVPLSAAVPESQEET